MKSTQITVRGYHCDAYGHVNNARFLEFYEDSRWNFLQPAVEEKYFENQGLLFIVVNLNIAYKKPILPNMVIDIQVTGVAYNNSSIVLSQRILDKQTNDVCSTAEVTFVLLNKDTMKPTPISDEIRAKFESLAS